MTRVVALYALLIAACFNPTFDNPACGPSGECPSGTNCSPVDNICRENVTGIDGSIDSAIDSAMDAAMDAAIDAPSDGANDGAQVDSAIDSSGPVCGDGTINGTETCDDRNTLACGTCNAACSAVIPPRAATGSITAALGSQQQDGETFTLDDGFNSPIVFEWDLNSAVTFPRVRVIYDSGYGQGQMAMAARDAIAGVGQFTFIAPMHSGGPTVMLDHGRLSALGNRPITETVTNGQFSVTGMSGGAAGDCPANVGCNVNDDCASGNCLAATQTCQ